MVLNNLAYAKSKVGASSEAVDLALQAVKISPDHPAILDTAGWLLVETEQDVAQGIRLLEKASALEPDNSAITRRLSAAKKKA